VGIFIGSCQFIEAPRKRLKVLREGVMVRLHLMAQDINLLGDGGV
jgi:hypothetical protein